ncbi:MAG TPA: endonuclease domain-containing protein [Longimicrobium sp.]|nr:endonuclease domain-containing protein [Longimicrobium sp.]
MRVAIRDAARAQRRNPTPSESQLWESLRGLRLDGRKFRRQQPVGPFIVDFYCPEERLVVEVDGAVHEGQEIKDAQRQEALESLGPRFVRVTNDEVRFELQTVLTRIRQGFASSSPLHHPSPLVGEGPGEGGTRRSDHTPPRAQAPAMAAASAGAEARAHRNTQSPARVA